jgi:hypothetical protein
MSHYVAGIRARIGHDPALPAGRSGAFDEQDRVVALAALGARTAPVRRAPTWRPAAAPG